MLKHRAQVSMSAALVVGCFGFAATARAADAPPTTLPAATDAPPATTTSAPAALPPKPHADETPAQRDARMAWWRKAKFGMFVHWGIYSVPAGIHNGKPVAGVGEWIMNKGKIPVDEYAKYAGQFDPEKFDADAFAQLAQDAGMKYMVITAKHHDGFAMFATKASPYNIVDATPYKRDPLKMLAEACPKHNIKLGFYYSQSQDWHHPGGAANGGHWDKAQDGDMDKYLDEIAVPEVTELLTNYGPFPAVLWFDTGGAMNPSKAAKFYPILETRPDLIVNNRLGGGFKGDTQTPEQHIPPQGYPGEDWETCMTINDTWGYKSADTKFKSTETLLHNLIDIASKGGNYLLNVGPTAEGVIPEPEAQRLLEIGAWLKVNGDSIYGTGPTPFGDEAGKFSETEKDKKTGKPVFVAAWDWRCTTKPGKLFVHILKWPADGIFELPAGKGTPAKVYLLADANHTPLEVKTDGGKITIALPAAAPDPVASVLCVETNGG